MSQPTTCTPALLRGLQGCCPVCGGHTMCRACLKVADACSVCGEALYPPRADAVPAYCVSVLVGHMLVPFGHIGEKLCEPPYWAHVALWIPVDV
jgi:uncharacterized protein (DUF983 family)